ncbi:hypothetical protein FOTG_11839 [Fusarium oxysporum f. sp. vasinfectum 25433]|uniref:Uncharacterized protein n=1 Tax=Fusarium oxysporum f. sp. vasinfectum 25433 TaxID=1089449 RepID=X0MI51_FUSOX|nr:hypothetical protein FOTG_11839 [Fusarium oxysporum f. sp. vasinfectum 25433]
MNHSRQSRWFGSDPIGQGAGEFRGLQSKPQAAVGLNFHYGVSIVTCLWGTQSRAKTGSREDV